MKNASLEGWKSNIHGYIHGKGLDKYVNTGGVEEMASTPSGVDFLRAASTPDVTGDIGL